MAVEDDLTQNPLHTGEFSEKEKASQRGESFSPSRQPENTHAERASQSDSDNDSRGGKVLPDGRRELTEDDCYDRLGYSFPTWKKWSILTVIFTVQMSMNFNSSIYSNAVPGLTEEFHISEQAARVGQMIFLVAYAFGCELWAPWSEEIGRKPILQLSMTLMNIWQLPSALAPNFASMVVGRFLGGLSLAGGSVTLGMTADIFQPNDQGYAVAFVVLSSVGGTTIGPFFGGMCTQWLHWRWVFWIQLIFGCVTQMMHIFVPETRSTILIDREAKRRRKSGEDPDIYGPNELKKPRFDLKDVIKIWIRPFEMFLREPIVLFLSLLSGFSDALIFTCIESFSLVFEQWNFNPLQIGLCFSTILIGYLLAYLIFLPDIWRQQKIRKEHGDASRLPERRLLLLLYIAPLEAMGLFGFAWTTMGPEYNLHWIVPHPFILMIAIANYAIYFATIDYMIAAYGPYSASATGGNGFARDFLAGLSAMYATPMYTNIGGRFHLQWASTILAILAIFVTIPIYVFYWKGPQIREKSKFAQTLAADRARNEGRRASRLSAHEKPYGA